MPITDKINEIIDRRIGRNGYEGKGHLEVIQKQNQFFQETASLLEEFNMLRDTILKQIAAQQGEYYHLHLEDPTLLQKIEAANPSEVLTKLSACQNECNRLEKRFNRDTINISVVGRARQGKSRLLQSISGLENEIIPADDGGDCTGAKSIISNSAGPTRAEVFFYSEMEIVNVVNDYLAALGNDTVIGRLNQIPQINVDAIEASITTGTDKTSLLGHLRKYVQHYDSYAHLLGRTLPVADPKEIRRYTSQYLDNGERTYEYLGVKEVKIFTEFNYKDAGKIQLVDTIGLFDTALGLEKKMMRTLADESDAAILLRLPNPQGDHVDEHDNKLYNDIEKNLGQETLSKWLFYVLNVWDANKKSGDFMYGQLQEQWNKTLRAAFVKAVNCADEETVENDIVIPILETLSANLADVDKNFMATANEKFNDCYASFIDLCNKVNNVLNSNFKHSLKTGGLFDQLYKKDLRLAQRLEELNMQYAGKDRECEEIKEEISKVLKTLDKLCPLKEDIKERLSRGDTSAHAQIVYHNLSDFTRAAICDKFEEINRSTIVKLQEGVKQQIIETLKSKDGGQLCLIPTSTDSDNPSSTEWMSAFIEQHLGDFPLLKAAFESILDYRLNIEGLLEYRVNNSIEHMDPESPLFEQHSFIGERDGIAEEIEQAILCAIPIIADKLTASITDLLYIPYNSFYARIKKLRERIIYSEEGETELKEFYRDNAAFIWHDRFAEIVNKQTALEALSSINNKLSQLRSKSMFNITIPN